MRRGDRGARAVIASLSSLCDLRVDADLQQRFIHEAIRRHAQVRGRWHVFEDATGKVKLRAVARAIETTWPIRTELCILRLESTERRASQMCADADQNK